MIRRFALIVFGAWCAACIYGELAIDRPNFTRLFVLIFCPLLIARVLRWGFQGRRRRVLIAYRRY